MSVYLAASCTTMSLYHSAPCALTMTSPILTLHIPNSHSGSTSFPAGPTLDGLQSVTSCTSIKLNTTGKYTRSGSDLRAPRAFIYLYLFSSGIKQVT